MDGSMKYVDEHKPCDICGSDNSTLIWEKKPWTTTVVLKDNDKTFHTKDVYCNECGTIYKDPMLSRASQKYLYDSDDYGRLYKPGNVNNISKMMLAEVMMREVYILDSLHNLSIDLYGCRVLEVGAGMGMLGKCLQSMGSDYHGVDLDKRSIEIAKKLFGLDIVKTSFDDFTDSKGFDAIFCCSTLEHMYSPREALERMCSMLRDGGIIFIEVPSYHFPYPHLIIDGFLSSAHNYTFSTQGFLSLANSCGLQCNSFGFTGHHKSMHFLLKKSQQQKQPLNVQKCEEVLSHLEEHDVVTGQINALGKELSKPVDVKTFIDKIRSTMPKTSNLALLAYAPKLLERGLYDLVIELMRHYQPDQSEDITLCRGSALHWQGVAFRQKGDFSTAYKLFKRAKEAYPQFDRHNCIKEMRLNGILGDAPLSSHIWFANEKHLIDLK